MPFRPARLIITDIDGTLLDDAGNLPDLNREALIQCRDRGVRTCLATGRRWTTCRRLLERLELRDLIDYCILNNGMILHDVAAGNTLYRRDFPFPLLLDAAARLHAVGLDPLVLGHNPDGITPDVFHRRDSLLNRDFVDKNAGFAVRIGEFTELEGRHLVELVLIGARADLEDAAAAMAGLPVETAILRNTYYAEYMLEVTPQGVSKLMGVRALLAHLGLDASEAVAIGDSENDFHMLRDLPRTIAVANAEDKVKAVVKEMTGSNAEGGFGQAVLRHTGDLC
jgi:Cof subfamily protein (haloacid dehalogenase superfamily)